MSLECGSAATAFLSTERKRRTEVAAPLPHSKAELVGGRLAVP